MAERPNSLSIGVCVLMALHLDPRSPLQELGLNRRHASALLEETVFGHRAGSADEETALARWIMQVEERVGMPVADLVMKTLEMATESVDALVDLFDSLSATIPEEFVEGSSAYGIYLRQVRLGFDELSFEAVTVLWRAVRERVEAIVESRKNGQLDSVANRSSGKTTEWAWPLSTEQLQDILRQECLEFELFQQENNNPQNNNNNNTKRRRARKSYEEMEVYIRSMLEKDPALPAAYFLRYLNCLRHNERVGALEALHQYFDHALVQQSGNPGPITTDILQFSAILLAMTHSKFGDSNLALLATEEAVRVAQQSKDAACVAFALGWLFEHKGQGTADRRELLHRCASRAAQKQLHPLVSGAHLTSARNAADASNGSGGPNGSSNDDGYSMWQTAWTHLQEVTSEPVTDQRAFDRPTFLYEDSKDTMRVKCLQQLVSAAIWDEIGIPEMSKAATMAALQNPESLSYDDLITAIQNVSRLPVYGTYVGNKNRKDGDNNNQKGGSSCAYARSVDTVLKLRKELQLEGDGLEGPLYQNVALTLHEWAVNRGDLHDARALQIVLDSAIHPGLANYDQFQFDIQMQKMHYLTATQFFDEAYDIARTFAKHCKTTGPLSNQVRVLLQWAYMILESDPNQCTNALNPLLEALAVADELKMHGLHAAGMSLLARVFLRLQNPSKSIAILTGVIPTLAQKEHVRFQAEAYFTLTAAHLKIAADEMKDAKKKAEAKLEDGEGGKGKATINIATPSLKQRYRKALASLKTALELFEEAQDLDKLRRGFYLQAFIYNGLEDFDNREKASTKFFAIEKATRTAPTPQGHNSGCPT